MPDLHRVRPAWVLPALCVWLCALAFAPQAKADSDAVFAVRNVQVDVTADNVNIARDQAFAQAQSKALTILFQRLTAHDQWNSLPKVSDSAVADLVLDIGVDQEKRSTVRYIATLSVRFKPDPVMRLLRNANIPYSEWRGQPIPVIPVAQTETGPLLWEPGNPWAAAWHGDAVQGLVQVQVPPAPAANAGWPDAAQTAAASQDTLAAYQQSLNSTDVLIAVAQPKHLAENQVGLEVTFSGIGPTASAVSGTKSYAGQTGGTIETLMGQAVGDVMSAIDESYKSHNSLEFDHSAQLDVAVSLNGLDDWSALRRKLASATPVRSYEVTALSRTNASLTLHYVGDQKQLEAVFIENGLVLSWAGDHWLLQNVVAQKKGADMQKGADAPPKVIQ